MKVGDTIKVWLPGETPWAEVVAVHDDGTWLGRICNRLVPEMTDSEHETIWSTGGRLPTLHSFKQGDVLRFQKVDGDGYSIWEPVLSH